MGGVTSVWSAWAQELNSWACFFMGGVRLAGGGGGDFRRKIGASKKTGAHRLCDEPPYERSMSRGKLREDRAHLHVGLQLVHRERDEGVAAVAVVAGTVEAPRVAEGEVA